MQTFFSLRYIYYSSIVGSTVQIIRAHLDGTNATVLVNHTSISTTIVDLTLDKARNRLYFCDSVNNLLKYIDLTTFRVYTALSGNLGHCIGLTIDNVTLYWTANGEGGFTGAIYKAEATYQSSPQMIADGFSEPTGIYAYNSRISLAPGNRLTTCSVGINICFGLFVSCSVERKESLVYWPCNRPRYKIQ